MFPSELSNGQLLLEVECQAENLAYLATGYGTG
jgi:hypothetical protein